MYLLFVLALLWATCVSAEPDCEITNDKIMNEFNLHCRLRTLNRDIEVGEFADTGLNHITSVTIRCIDEDRESVLTNQTFSALTALRTVRLERCRIASLPAVFGELTQLSELSVTSYNKDVNMVIASGALDYHHALQHLDFSHNALWSLPSHLLCPLTGLQSINMSHNQLEDAFDLGLPKSAYDGRMRSCLLSELHTLDLSGNRLVTVRSDMWSSFPNIRTLAVNDNHIEVLQEGALSGLHDLQDLDMSENRLVTLPQDLLSSARELTRLQLANNSISALTPGVFQGLDQLQLLDLSGNQLTSTWINSQTFSGLVRLVVLDMSGNALGQLDPSMFRDLYSLQVLRLDTNQLDVIAPNTFLALSNLHTLVLSYNRLQRLDAMSLNGLHVLSSLALDHNVVDFIHAEAFNNVTGLRELKLNNNRMTSIPRALTVLHGLEKLLMGDNYVSRIMPKYFDGLSRLQSLHLEKNMLTNVTRDALRSLTALKILNLASNHIKKIDIGSFDRNEELEAIRLDNNMLTEMYGLFQGLSNLHWLNISDNEILHFDYIMLPKGIRWLDLHRNKIEELGDIDDVANHISITMLDASFNRLASLSGRSLPSGAQLLLLNDNQIAHVEQYTFFLMGNLSRVDLFANQLTSLELTALRLNMPNSSTPVPNFYIGGNPFVCDCSMEWLQRYDEINSVNQYPRIMDIDSIYCRLTYSRSKAFVPLVEAESSMFLCPYKRHCFSICFCCEFDACDCEMTCPAKCNCYHDQAWSNNIVDCSNNEFKDIPNLLPMDATEVSLDGNYLKNLSSLTFLGRKNLRVLYLNNSQVEHVYNETFVGLPQLISLHLEGNLISQLRGYEFLGLNGLRELYLHNNRLRSLADNTFAPLVNLEVLRLDGNQLSTFTFSELQRNSYLIDVKLAGNRWTCECEFLKDMRTWLSVNLKRVDDANELVCRFGSSDRELPVNTGNTTCYKFPMDATMSASEYAVILICAFAVVVLLVFLLVLLSVYRTDLRAWIYSRFGLRVCYRAASDDELDRLFDAFVSHSDKDRAFVQNVLVPKLERCEPPYRLALHDRDFAHSAYLADTIVEAVECSRRTIMVLSKNFVENEWCRFQFKSAHHELLKDRRKRLIVILLGDVAVRDLDPDLRLCIKTNTCIRWQDKLFWEKLRYALPDVRERTRILNSMSHYSEIDESQCYIRSPDTVQSIYE